MQTSSLYNGTIFDPITIPEIQLLLLIIGTVIVAFIAGYWASRRFSQAPDEEEEEKETED